MKQDAFFSVVQLGSIACTQNTGREYEIKIISCKIPPFISIKQYNAWLVYANHFSCSRCFSKFIYLYLFLVEKKKRNISENKIHDWQWILKTVETIDEKSKFSFFTKYFIFDWLLQWLVELGMETSVSS